MRGTGLVRLKRDKVEDLQEMAQARVGIGSASARPHLKQFIGWLLRCLKLRGPLCPCGPWSCPSRTTLRLLCARSGLRSRN